MNSWRAVVVLLLLATSAVSAQERPAPPASMLQRVGIDQKLEAQLPLDLTFRDDTGKTVRLGDYFGKRPVVLALVYYGCPSLCTMTLNGMNQSFRTLSFDIGKEYEVITVSFDPSETPALAAEKKANYVREYGRAGGAQGWHFLTGDAPAIAALTQAVGFRYVWDEPTKQFAHGSAIMLATPQGKLSKYFYGLEYAPKDLRLGIIEASEERVGTLADSVTLLCYQYNPMTGKYGFAIMATLRAAGVLTLLLLGGFITIKLLRERRSVIHPSAQVVPGGGKV
ncbi:MAG: SCO family protein [Tepidisphaeraceae bacterium]